MPTDEELTRLLGRALDTDASAEPSLDRVAELRRRAEAAREALDESAETTMPAPTRLPVERRPGPARWVVAAAAAIVGLVAGAGVARVADGDDGISGSVEYDGQMSSTDGTTGAAELTVVAIGIGRVVELDTTALPILPTGEYYQVWFVGPGDASSTPNRISAGTFHPDAKGRSEVQFAAAVNPALYPVVEITAEPGDGDPGSSGHVVLLARIGG